MRSVGKIEHVERVTPSDVERVKQTKSDALDVVATDILEKVHPAQPPSDSLDVGDEIRISRGPDTFYPVKYNGFTVGPISATTKVREGETGAHAWLRLHRWVDTLYIAEFELAQKDFASFLEQAREKLKS